MYLRSLIKMEMLMEIQVQARIQIQIQLEIIQIQIQIQLPHFETLEKGEADVEEEGEDESPPAQNICWSLSMKREYAFLSSSQASKLR